MSSSRSEYMLKYQKAKVKLLEYNIPEDSYPKFPLNYKDLAFPTVLTLSEYAEAIINSDMDAQFQIKERLNYCSEYYDAAFKAREQQEHDQDFLLSGAAAYFFLDDFGSAKVLSGAINSDNIQNNAKGILTEIFNILFIGRRKQSFESTILKFVEIYLQTGREEQVLRKADDYMIQMDIEGSPLDAFFSEVLCAVLRIMIGYSARNLLPEYSSIEEEKWKAYFNQKNAIKLIWPSQKLIGEKGILRGKNAVVQLPTGVGKTKSIELIIRSMFLDERGDTALIVAPLRALCNEITDDMNRAFQDDVIINQFSDILEFDFESLFSNKRKQKILICTPEKLQYIFHHQPDYINEIDLFVFDEGHMFDDESRGALYELLVTDIVINLKSNQQMVLMSAVLSNADKICYWAFGEEGILAYDEKIRSTPKVIGFTSKTKEIHYFSESFSEEDFYIPRAINITKLKMKRRETKEKIFPELSKSQDIAIYYSNVLCKNGGIALYLNQRRSVPKILERVVDLEDRSYDLSNIKQSTDMDELDKLNNLIKAYYGDDYVYTKACKIGVLPHYSYLPNGLRIAIEYAFRKEKIKIVACTSTLAQGVNIPIKYLIMTSMKSAQKMMTNRSFQNLMGRTARSGVYTEGSIIVTDSKLFDNKRNGRGFYEWKEATDLFNSKNSEECGSAILKMVQDFEGNYQLTVYGEFVTQYICDNFTENWEYTLVEELMADINKRYPEVNLDQCRQNITSKVKSYKSTIGTIESEISYVLCKKGILDDYDKMQEEAAKTFENTLAMFLATDEEKKHLSKILFTIVNDIYINRKDIRQYSTAMLPMDIAKNVKNWIEEYNINEETFLENQLLEIIIDLYNEIYEADDISANLCHDWVHGMSYIEMSQRYEKTLQEIEKICGHYFSYKLNFLIGNIIDFVNSESTNIGRLMILQKKIKYGIDSQTSLSICEVIFNDRYLASLLSNELGNKIIKEDQIIKYIKSKRDEVKEVLSDYPTYFEKRIKYLK